MFAITNSYGENASPWNIPLWIFISFKVYLLAVNYTLQFYHGFRDKFTDFLDILHIF